MYIGSVEGYFAKKNSISAGNVHIKINDKYITTELYDLRTKIAGFFNNSQVSDVSDAVVKLKEFLEKENSLYTFSVSNQDDYSEINMSKYDPLGCFVDGYVISVQSNGAITISAKYDISTTNAESKEQEQIAKMLSKIEENPLKEISKAEIARICPSNFPRGYLPNLIKELYNIVGVENRGTLSSIMINEYEDNVLNSLDPFIPDYCFFNMKGQFFVPESKISGSGFLYRRYVFSNSLNIPGTIREIRAHAFDGCIGLRKVFIPSVVEIVEHSAFANCKDLKIYCAAKSQPKGWNLDWNPENCAVEWGSSPIEI